MRSMTNLAFGLLTLVCFVGCASSPKVVHKSNPSSTATTAVKDAKMLMDMGKLQLAEQKLRSVLQSDPENSEARYYLALVKQAEQQQGERPRAYIQTIPQQPIY